jgi:hypothetical protein
MERTGSSDTLGNFAHRILNAYRTAGMLRTMPSFRCERRPDALARRKYFLPCGIDVHRPERTQPPADTAGMAKKPELPNLFWLTYRHPDGRPAGVVVIESHGFSTRLKASLAGADKGLGFVSGQKLAPPQRRAGRGDHDRQVSR